MWAPEIYRDSFASERIVSSKNDIFLLGHTLWPIFNDGKYPFVRFGPSVTDEARAAHKNVMKTGSPSLPLALQTNLDTPGMMVALLELMLHRKQPYRITIQ